MLGTEFFFGPISGALLVVISTVLLYWYSIQNHDYWEKKKVPFAKPLPFVGTLLSYVKKPLQEVDSDRYKKFGRIFGHYEGTRPVLMLAEPTILRDILVKDFHIFPNRRTINIGDSILDNMVSVVQGEDWKRIRTVITPTFSTGKIKRMLSIFKDSTKTLIQNFHIAIQKGEAIEAKRVYGAFTMDIIASSAFSTKLDSFNDPDNEFVDKARKVFRPKYSWRTMMLFLFPNLRKWLKISFFPPSSTNFFRDVTLRIISERKKTGQTRNDFLQLLMDTAKELQEDPKSELHEKESEDIASSYGGVSIDHQIFRNVTKKNLSLDELVAQCVIFFLAGYDTTASTLSLASYELALNPDVQEKVHQELVDTLKETNGELTYDALQSMKYLDCIISETLRLYPPAIRTERQANSEYTLGDTGITIPKNMIVSIPVYAMHRDPEFFPNPDKFIPERFTPEERQKRDPYCYQPFGVGPRNCVGMRFALTEIKLCLAHVIANFKIKKSPKTSVPLKFLSGQAGLLQPKDVFVSMIPRDDNPIVK